MTQDEEQNRDAPGLDPGRIIPHSRFSPTHWSVVLDARDTNTRVARDALAELCRNYWYPLYVFVRRMGRSAEESEDLTQEFFARLIEHHYLDIADRERGKFRTFLLSVFKHFLANEWDKERALKRGGGRRPVSIDQAAAEGRYSLEPVDEMTPERLYERRWAMTLIEQALGRLEEEMETEGKGALFDALKGSLGLPSESGSYAGLAERLGMSVSAVKVALHRLRNRYRTMLRALIEETVESPELVDEEVAYLSSIFG